MDNEEGPEPLEMGGSVFGLEADAGELLAFGLSVSLSLTEGEATNVFSLEALRMSILGESTAGGSSDSSLAAGTGPVGSPHTAQNLESRNALHVLQYLSLLAIVLSLSCY